MKPDLTGLDQLFGGSPGPGFNLLHFHMKKWLTINNQYLINRTIYYSLMKPN